MAAAPRGVQTPTRIGGSKRSATSTARRRCPRSLLGRMPTRPRPRRRERVLRPPSAWCGLGAAWRAHAVCGAAVQACWAGLAADDVASLDTTSPLQCPGITVPGLYQGLANAVVLRVWQSSSEGWRGRREPGPRAERADRAGPAPGPLTRSLRGAGSSVRLCVVRTPNMSSRLSRLAVSPARSSRRDSSDAMVSRVSVQW